MTPWWRFVTTEPMKRVVYIGMLLAIVTAGIFLIFKLGYEPQPVGIMKPSYFDKPDQIGATVYRRFYVPIEQKKIVLFGIPPQPTWHQEILKGFMEAAAAEKRPFEIMIAESQMPPIDLTNLPPLDVRLIAINTETQAEFADQLRLARESGKRTLVYMPSVFSSHLLPGNAVNRYEAQTGENLFAITTGPLALRHDQEYVVEPVCIGSQLDGRGLAPLGCATMLWGRKFYRKKLPQDRWVAAMNSPKPEDYLLLVSYPGQDKATPPAATPPAKPPSL